MAEEDSSGLGLKFGTIEQARAMLGQSSPLRVAEFEVNLPMIQYYCAAVQDPNPAYWDADVAGEIWGGIIAPPGMLQTWLLPLPWRPDGKQDFTSMITLVPLPGEKPINVSTEFRFFEPVFVGDRLSMSDRLTELSEAKTTRLGTGYFLTTEAEIRNQHGRLVATSTNVLFRYQAAA
jgi:acyl dehydratase